MITVGHAGGADEIALLLLPAAIFFIVLQIRRRHYRDVDERAEDGPTDGSGG